MKDFLKKKQKADLEKYGWQLMDGKDGTIWFGSDFDEGWFGNVVDLVSLDHRRLETCRRYGFSSNRIQTNI